MLKLPSNSPADIAQDPQRKSSYSRTQNSKTWTRRQTLQALGIGAAAGLLSRPSFAQGPSFPQGAIIRGILRDYRPEELAGGATLFHEHMQLGADFNQKFTAASAAARDLSNLGSPIARRQAEQAAANAKGKAAPKGNGKGKGGSPPAAGPRIMDDSDLMAAEVARVKDEGVACIVDCGHPDMGRDINFLREVAMKSGVPIVAGGGFYSQPYYPASIATMSEDEIYEALIRMAEEETLGVFGEIGSWDEMTPNERKVFRAVGRAHAATNLPIITHTGIPGKAAIEQLNILEDQGVDPSRVVIGHLGGLVDEDVYVHRNICRRGAFVGFDRQGGGGDARVVPMVQALLDAGYQDNLLFAADGSSNYGKTMTVFLPKLRDAGIPDETLTAIMRDNPRRLLAFVPKLARG